MGPLLRTTTSPAFAASPLRRGILCLSSTRLVYRAVARRRRAKDGGPEQRQLKPDRQLAEATGRRGTERARLVSRFVPFARIRRLLSCPSAIGQSRAS